MQPADIPYQLIGSIGPSSPLLALPKDASPSGDQQSLQMLTTLYITSMYYSALSNLYLQSILPDDVAVVEAEMPRIATAVARTYADFTAAAAWLSQVGETFIAESPAKSYYDEAQEMGAAAVKNIETVYAAN